MVFSFTSERPVLNFGPRHHVRRKPSPEYLLWPAWAYRVVAPRVRERQLNVLQRAVLGLCRAGAFRAEVIAENLSIDIKLAAFILAEIGSLGYLDTHGGPTDKGLRILDDDAIKTYEMVTGYVFQDPWSGDLWPRFVEKLDYSELEHGDGEFPALLLGPTGKPRRQWAFMVLPKDVPAPVTPSPRAIVEAVSRHRKGLRHKDVEEPDDGEDGSGSFAASGVEIDRVSFIQKEPQPVFLTTYLYVPESAEGETDWYACDPFGLGRSVRLRRRVETVMQDKRMKGLYQVVNRLMGKALEVDYAEQRNWLESLELQAGLEVERRLTVDVRNHSVFDQVVAMESARQEVLLLGDKCPPRKLDEVLRAGVKVLEATFTEMAAEYPLSGIWKRVYVRRKNPQGKEYLAQQNDRKIRAAVYTGAFREIGFAEPIADSFLNVQAGHVRAVADYDDNWRLRPLVTATALCAQQDPSHPLWTIADQNPGLLNEVEQVASLGGNAGHANDDPVTVADAEGQAERVYKLVAVLLGFGLPDTVNSINDGGSHGET